MQTLTRERAASNATLRELARALGGDVAGRQVLCPGPNHSPRDRSLSVAPSIANPDGFIVHSFSPKHDWRECRAYVLAKLGHRPAAPSSSTKRKRSAGHTAGTNLDMLARELWDEGCDPGGTPAQSYLASRGLVLSDEIAGYGVRFHPRCPWRDESQKLIRLPAMLVAFRSIANPRIITAVQRVALKNNGERIGRRMLGPVSDAAMMIDADEHVTMGLVIAEGFETALSGRQLGWRPVWALGSAGAIAAFPVLSGIETLTVLAEHDDTNARAIESVGTRWLAASREVLIVYPRVGSDANDALRGIPT